MFWAMWSFIDLPDKIKYSTILKWLNENVVKRISFENKEPKWMLEFRLKSLKIFQQMPMPTWGPDISDLDFDNMIFFATPKWLEKYATKWEDVPEDIKVKFEKLWIPEAERKYLAWAWGQFDSKMLYHNIKEKWASKWIIFEDMNDALHNHQELVKKYFMKLIPPTYHKFAALHGAVWSWGTFIYIPPNTKLTEPLQTYFRMNTVSWWQFEHTLIIVDENAQWNYIEWCSAPKYDKRALHAWWVEIYVKKWAKMRYSSVENWSTDTYNLNTKKALLEENAYIEWIWWNFGSAKTMLYPMSVLKWDNSRAEHWWVAYATWWQIQDVGAKVLHIWKNTKSKIISKSVCQKWWINVYRWLVEVRKTAKNAVNTTDCDTILLDWQSTADAIPTIINENPTASISHEASTSKISEDMLFYLQSRWLSKEDATSFIINWFMQNVIKKLPLEYAWELNRFMELEIKGI